MTGIVKIYFDMDGVLADFNRGVEELCGLDPIDQNTSTEEEEEKVFGAIRQQDHFYRKLKPVPGVAELFRLLQKEFYGKVEILTGVPSPRRNLPEVGEDKVAWVREHLSEDVKVNLVRRAEKKNYCTGKGCILIDDYEKNIAEWEANGGTGILFRSVEQVLTVIAKEMRKEQYQEYKHFQEAKKLITKFMDEPLKGVPEGIWFREYFYGTMDNTLVKMELVDAGGSVLWSGSDLFVYEIQYGATEELFYFVEELIRLFPIRWVDGGLISGSELGWRRFVSQFEPDEENKRWLVKNTADTLDFEPFDAVAAGENWAVEYPDSARDSVRILINGKDLHEYFNILGELGHVGAGWVCSVITDCCNTGREWSTYTAELGCCRDCGNPGCCSIGMNKKEDDEYVWWTTHYGYTPDGVPPQLFRFEKKQYEQAMKKLKELAGH